MYRPDIGGSPAVPRPPLDSLYQKRRLRHVDDRQYRCGIRGRRSHATRADRKTVNAIPTSTGISTPAGHLNDAQQAALRRLGDEPDPR